MARITWSLRAIENLDEICNYIAKNSPGAAENLAKQVKARVESLGSSPYIGRVVAEQKNSVDRNLREIIVENYRIVYYLKEDALEIITVFHGKRKPHFLV